MWVWVIIIAAIVVAIAIGISNSNKMDATRDTQNDWLKQNGVRPVANYRYVNSLNTVSARYVVDTTKQCVYLSNDDTRFKPLPFSEINGAEILEDGDVSGGVGRAIVGGALAGGVGAIVGGLLAGTMGAIIGFTLGAGTTYTILVEYVYGGEKSV